MAHKDQFEFVERIKAVFPEYFTRCRVLEVGSLDINGSVRRLFENCEYIGLDVAAGNGVDVVCQAQDYAAPDASFDLVISCEVMEHNPYWKETINNMIRMTRPGGLVVMSCATLGRPEHGTARSEPNSSPLTVEKGWNYYRNLTRRDLERAVDLDKLATWETACNWDSYDLYLLGIKAPAALEMADKVASIFDIYHKQLWRSYNWIRRAVRGHLKLGILGLR